MGCAGIEGTSSYGAGLSRHLKAAGVSAVEVERPKRQHLRRKGKSDPIDAEAAARAVLAGAAAGVPKSGDGRVEMVHGALAFDGAWWWHRMVEPRGALGLGTLALELPSCVASPLVTCTPMRSGRHSMRKTSPSCSRGNPTAAWSSPTLQRVAKRSDT